ncbi:MAG: MFS transporter [Rhodobacteraceae bacterium]|nr:MFS transporter [Paracoccaceae bacterium]
MSKTSFYQKTAGLFAAVPMFGLATGALFPLVALELEALGESPGFIGGVTAAYYLGSFLAAACFGSILKRIGPVNGFIVSAAIAAVATAALSVATSQTEWLALRFAGGFSLGAYYIVVDGWFQRLSDRSNRGKIFAAYETIRLAATALGPALLIFGSLQANIAIIIGAYALSILPVLTVPSEPVPIKQPRLFRGLTQVVTCFPAALVLCACGGFANASFYGLSAIYATASGWSEAGVALFIGVVLVAPAVSELPIGAAADRFGRMAVAILLCLTAAAACLLLANVTIASPLMGALCAAVVGASMVPLYALGLSRIADASAPDQITDATTAGLVCYNLGAFVGPALTGAVMSAFGPNGLYITLAGCAAAALIAATSDRAFAQCCPEQTA